MIPNKILKEVLAQEPTFSELTKPDWSKSSEDVWGDFPLLRWEGKANTEGDLFFPDAEDPKARIVVGKELEAVALDIRIKALQLTRSGEGVKVFLDPYSQSFRYCYLKADERQDLYSQEYYIWGWEFLMYCPTYGKFRLFPTNKSSRIGVKALLEQADFDLRDVRLTTQLIETRLINWYAMRIIPINTEQKSLDFPLE
jgi:hypothetical protein